VQYQSDASVFPTGGAQAAMLELDPLGTPPGRRSSTQKGNAATLCQSVDGVKFQVAPEETRCIAYNRLVLNSPVVVSTQKTGDDHDRSRTT
jgi:hypothetical protein